MARSRLDDMKFKTYYITESLNQETNAAINHGRQTMIRIIAQSVLRNEQQIGIGLKQQDSKIKSYNK
ncbi:hypothetical protein [Desulfocucumis palustris]|uniref:hypothetical protein n=1 Tax=Desulfocucumis palustris TaxID=1898651 RepID=UPI000CEA10DF|nr:hypothetical protein [Desulfocucumis palustris]